MSNFSWSEFFVISGLGLFGTAAILPYGFALAGDKIKIALVKFSMPVLVLISFLQTAVLIILATGIGLLAAKHVGLGAPYILAFVTGAPVPTPLKILPPALILAVLIYVCVALLERFVFAKYVPEVLIRINAGIPVWMRLLASFYGGFVEEILMRLFLVSGFVWILGRFWQNSHGMPADGAYWIAILLTSLLFGLGHLPATKIKTPLTPMIIVRAIALNGIAGIGLGWLYWRYGIEAAMLSHFSIDILLHVIGPVFYDNIYGNSGNKGMQSDTNMPDNPS